MGGWGFGAGGTAACLGEAHVGAHALARLIDIPDLDLTVQPSRQQQVASLGEEPAMPYQLISLGDLRDAAGAAYLSHHSSEINLLVLISSILTAVCLLANSSWQLI